MDGGDGIVGEGKVTCATWIKRPENAHLVLIGKSSKPCSSLEIFSFDPKTTSLSSSPKATYVFEDGVEPVSIAVHPSGDDVVCSTSTSGCKLFELYGREENLKLLAKELLPLKEAGPQKCLAFSVDGSRFATGGVDGHLRIFEWPNMRIILDEPRAHKSFQDMDFSLDSEFLASTSTDGSARIWKTDGVPVTSLTRNSDERIELCRFSKDGTRPFLFTTVQRGNKPLTVVWDISTWKKVGHKRLLNKRASIMSISLDGKYLALGSKDGDVCVVEVKKMEIRHLSKRLHLGSNITSLEFCPSERVILTTSVEWGFMVTKLTVPADWKEWQIYLLLLGLFVASLVLFYIFFENSDSFWNFPEPVRPKINPILGDSQSDDHLGAFGPLDISSALPLQNFNSHRRQSPVSVNVSTALKAPKLMSNIAPKAISGSMSSMETDGAKKEEEKSEIYSHNMTEAMGAVLTYRHELGMNYNFICPDMIVGSCLQTPEDVDKLRNIGVKTIFCLQQDSDLDININAIREYANSFDDIQHVRAPIRDFDGFDLRMRLPAVVGVLHKAINRNGGVTYIHCTAGLGRAPATAGAHIPFELPPLKMQQEIGQLIKTYMFWIQGYKLSQAHNLLMSKRPCFPKLDAIKTATADIKNCHGLKKKAVTLTWNGRNCSSVEISGLDIGWGQRIPLSFDKEQGLWTLHRELPEGHYEYKYIVDGEWVCNKYDLTTHPNKDGHVNNYINVSDSSPNSINATVRKRMAGDDPELTKNERVIIREYLEGCPDEE
ncbi:hypothetical protein M9H77_34525 [Catharanthus roseus]|uniref:Uncharacterized protein n=1 Tax=Catharanthus roseus TaxID=4058 RepID=A0ACB9ZQ14_CATRO|nr:hypothetical protein M9H77_34525 [Catharanthus roseus]